MQRQKLYCIKMLSKIVIVLFLMFISFTIIYNRMLLVESRELLSEVLINDITGIVLIERGENEKARLRLADNMGRIAQYVVIRQFSHSNLPTDIERYKNCFKCLKKEESVALKMYVSCPEDMFAQIESRLYLWWKDSREHWTLWGNIPREVEAE